MRKKCPRFDGSMDTDLQVLLVVIACVLVLFFLAARENGRSEENRRLCLEAGCVSYDQGYCIRTVNGTDQVVPLEQLRENQDVQATD